MMPSRRSLASARAGFTMVELLVSITLTVVITAFITGGFHFGMRAWESTSRTAGVQDAAIVDRSVATWIEGAMAVSRSVNAGASSLEFDGGVDSLTFVTLSDGRTQSAGLVKMTLHQGPQGSLVIDASIFRRGSTSNVSRSVLAKDASLTMAYFGFFSGGSRPAWRPDWRGMSLLPLLIAFRIKTRDRRSEPPVLVRLRTGNALMAGLHQ